jgi:hypothetical protein
VQLFAQEAKAWARIGDHRQTEVALDKGRRLLESLPYPENLEHHFVVDPTKFDFYAMDCYRTLAHNKMAETLAKEVIQASTDGTAEIANERMLGLSRVAVQRSRFPVTHSSHYARQGSGQSLGRLLGTTHSELDLLVDLVGQTPRLIFRPHEVRSLAAACCRPIPSQGRCVSECFDRAGEQQHRSVRNLHARRLRCQIPAHPALPYRGIPPGRRGRAGTESRECCAHGIGRCFA